MDPTGEGTDSIIARISSQDARPAPSCEESHQDGERRPEAERQTGEKIQIRGSVGAGGVNSNTCDAPRVTTDCVGTRNSDCQIEIQERGSSPKKPPCSTCNVEGEEAKNLTSSVTDTCAHGGSKLLDEVASEGVTMPRKSGDSKYISLPNENNDLKITFKRKLKCSDNNKPKKKKKNECYTSSSSGNTEAFSEDEEEGDKRERDKEESDGAENDEKETQNRHSKYKILSKIFLKSGVMCAIPTTTSLEPASSEVEHADSTNNVEKQNCTENSEEVLSCTEENVKENVITQRQQKEEITEIIFLEEKPITNTNNVNNSVIKKDVMKTVISRDLPEITERPGIKVRSWEELRSPTASTSPFVETTNLQAPSHGTEQDSTDSTKANVKKYFTDIRITMKNIIVILHHVRSIVALMHDNFPSKEQAQELKDNMTKLNAYISKLRRVLKERSYKSTLEFLNSGTGLQALTADEYNKLIAITEHYSQVYNLPRGTYINISSSTDNSSRNNTQKSSHSALLDMRTNLARSQSSTLSGSSPTMLNPSFPYIPYRRQHASSDYHQQYVNYVPPPSYFETLISNTQHANVVPPSHINRVTSTSIAQQAPVNNNPNNITYISGAFTSNIVNASGSTFQTNASLNMPQMISSQIQIVQPDEPVMVLPSARQTTQQQSMVNASWLRLLLRKSAQENSVNTQQHGLQIANPSVSQLANSSVYQGNPAGSSVQHQILANLPAQESNAASAKLQQFSNARAYQQNIANPSVQQALANQFMSRQNLQQHFCYADCAKCSQDIRENQSSAQTHGFAFAARSDTMTDPVTNTPNCMLNSRVEISAPRNKTPDKTPRTNQQNVHQEFAEIAQSLSQKPSTQVAPQTFASQNTNGSQNRTCDTLSDEDQTRTLTELADKFNLDLNYFTDIQKFLLCEQLKSNYDILMWIRKNAPKSISERLDRAIWWSLSLHKYMRQRTNEILRDYCLDNQSESSSTSVTEKLSGKVAETSTAKQLPERSSAPTGDSIANTPREEARALDMPELDGVSEISKIANNTKAKSKENTSKTAIHTQTRDKDGAYFSRDNEGQGEKVDSVFNDAQKVCDDEQRRVDQSRVRNQSIISYAPRTSTPVALSLKSSSLDECECTGMSRTCLHCKDIAEIVELCLDIEEDNKNEKVLSVTSSHGTSDEGCESVDAERLVIDEQSGTCNEARASDETSVQPHVSEDEAEADPGRAAVNEARDTASASPVQQSATDTAVPAEPEDATRKQGLDTHSGVKNINKLFERITAYKRQASPRIFARELRVQLVPLYANVRRYTPNEDDARNRERVRDAGRDAAVRSSDTENETEEESKDDCETSGERSGDNLLLQLSSSRNTREKNNNESTRNDPVTYHYVPLFVDCDAISDHEEDGTPSSKTEDDITRVKDTSAKGDILETKGAPNCECIPETKENATSLAGAAETRNKEEYKDNCEILSDKSDDRASDTDKGCRSMTKTDLRANYKRNSDGTGVRSPETENDVALQSLESAVVREDVPVEGEDVPEDARNKHASNTRENAMLQSISTVDSQTEVEYKDNCEVSAKESGKENSRASSGELDEARDVNKRSSDEILLIYESCTPHSDANSSDDSEDDTILLKEFQFDEKNLLSPEATFQMEDALNNKVFVDAERDATSQLQIGTEDQNEERGRNDDRGVSSENSDRTTSGTEGASTSNPAELSSNSEENVLRRVLTSELDATELPCESRENDVVPTILKIQTISESAFNEMNANYANEIAQNDAVTVISSDVSATSQNNAREQSETNIVDGGDDSERVSCLRCKRPSTERCEKCRSALYCSKRCASLHWKSSHHKVCTRVYGSP